MLKEIQRLRSMTVAELRHEWQRLYGEPSSSRNRDYLWKRLAWRVQELQLGGLSDRAKARIDELAPVAFIRARTPVMALPESPPPEASSPPRTKRDPRLPAPGTILSRQYHGRELRLTVLDGGFELKGVVYGSLTEAAKAATGSHWNGRLFWRLVQRKRTV